MSPDATPKRDSAAQEAYKAYAEVLVPLAPWGTPDFAQLPDIHQRAWEAVVLAVCDHIREEETPDVP